jgi:hypothetical protein
MHQACAGAWAEFLSRQVPRQPAAFAAFDPGNRSNAFGILKCRSTTGMRPLADENLDRFSVGGSKKAVTAHPVHAIERSALRRFHKNAHQRRY